MQRPRLLAAALLLATATSASAAAGDRQPVLAPDAGFSFADESLHTAVELGEQAGVDALLRAICSDSASADWIIKLRMSLIHNGDYSATDTDSVQWMDLPGRFGGKWSVFPAMAEGGRYANDVLKASSLLLQHGWCTLKESDADAGASAPALAHVIAQASTHLLESQAMGADAMEAGEMDEFDRRGRAGFDDDQLHLLVRRAMRALLLMNVGIDSTAHPGLMQAVSDYRTAWGEGIRAIAPQITADAARERQKKQAARLELAGIKVGADNRDAGLKVGGDNAGVQHLPLNVNVDQNNAGQPLSNGDNDRSGSIASNQGLHPNANVNLNEQDVKVRFADSNVDVGAGADADADAASLALAEAAAVEATEQWEADFFAAHADSNEAAGAQARSAADAAVASAAVRRIVEAFTALVGHEAMQPLRVAFGGLLARSCSTRDNDGNAFTPCTAAVQLSILRLFVTAALPALHDYAWTVEGPALRQDGQGRLWDDLPEDGARATSRLLFGAQVALLQVRDLCSLTASGEAIGLLAQQPEATVKTRLFGARGVFGKEGAVDPHGPTKEAAKDAAQTQQALHPHTRKRGWQAATLHDALTENSKPHSASVGMLQAVGLVVDAGAGSSGSGSDSLSNANSLHDANGEAGSAPAAGGGFAFTRDFLDMSQTAGDRLIALLMPQGHPMPAPLPTGPAAVKLTSTLQLPPMQPGIDNIETMLWAPEPLPFDLQHQEHGEDQDHRDSLSSHRSSSASELLAQQPRALHQEAVDALQAASVKLARYMLLVRLLHSRPGMDVPASAPPLPPLVLHSAALAAYGRTGYTKLFEVAEGVPVAKYSENAVALSDARKWEARRLRVTASGVSFADDDAKARTSRNPVTRQLLHSAIEAILLPAPRPLKGVKDAALASIEARHKEGRVCGVVATGDTKTHRRLAASVAEGRPEVDAWAQFEKLPPAAPAAPGAEAPPPRVLATDGALFVPLPGEHTRFYSFCTRTGITAASTAAAKATWLAEARGVATAFCAAAHDEGLLSRVRLEQWWAVQVLRAERGEGARTSLSQLAATELKAGGLATLDCDALLNAAPVVGAPAAVPAARITAIDGQYPPDVTVVSGSATAGASVALARLKHLADREGDLAHMKMAATAAKSLFKHSHPPAWERVQATKHAASSKPDNMPPLADRVFWSTHARTTVGGRRLETALSPTTAVALWTAYHGAWGNMHEQIDEDIVSSKLRREAADGAPEEDHYTTVYVDDEDRLLVIAFKAAIHVEGDATVSSTFWLVSTV